MSFDISMLMKIKRFYRYLFPLVLGICCFLVVKVYAATELTQPQPIQLQVVTENFPPYNFINGQGELDGISYLIVQRLLSRANLKVPIQVLPWARAYRTAVEQPNTLIFSIVKTPKRTPQFIWLLPLFAVDVYLHALPHHPIQMNLKDNLGEQIIGVIRNSSGEEYLQRNGIKRKNYASTVNFEQLYLMLLHERIDFAFIPTLMADYYNKKYNTPKNVQPLALKTVNIYDDSMMYVALSLNSSPELHQRLSVAAKQLRESGEIYQMLHDYRQKLHH
jgi:polar amino acid transport system substrate-binding protein